MQLNTLKWVDDVSQILNDDDLERLTGFTRKHKQREVLQELGIKFFRRADGKPVVPTLALKAALGITNPDEQDVSSAVSAIDEGFNLGV